MADRSRLSCIGPFAVVARFDIYTAGMCLSTIAWAISDPPRYNEPDGHEGLPLKVELSPQGARVTWCPRP